MTQADIGLIGLAVMGQNLVLNLERNGYRVAVYNRTTAVTDEFVAAHPANNCWPHARWPSSWPAWRGRGAS
jgi:6-phosphogluconate dehydrogenase